jgi:regulator of protease activity HflC (stomatin/prohibitin superfamily)
MTMRTTTTTGLALAALALSCGGCAATTIEPGHRGLYFEPTGGGLRREVLQPGTYRLGWCFLYCTRNRVDDFDVTFSTHTENIVTKSAEGLDLDLKLSIIYRPVVSELYQLDTEIGANYYDEVIGPEFRSACRGVFARHSYTELQKKNEAIENEVEAEVRRRTAGKHVEVASVTLEAVGYAPEIAEKIRAKIAGEQEASREEAAIAWEAARKKEIAETSAAQAKLELEQQAEAAHLKAEQELAAIDTERQVAKAQAEIDKTRAEADAQKKIIEARADAEVEKQMARAHAERQRAETAGVTPMQVMMHAYDALGALGGTGTTIVLGDWAHVPSFLFPRVPSLQSAFSLPFVPLSQPPSSVQATPNPSR